MRQTACKNVYVIPLKYLNKKDGVLERQAFDEIKLYLCVMARIPTSVEDDHARC
jgi:hypothetical protein